jgi:pimeloyl-ACP methyl ester carboxylesterase
MQRVNLMLSCAFVGLLAIACLVCQQSRQPAQESMRADSLQLGDLSQHFRRAGQGPPLLLIHGLTNTWRVWRPYLKALGASHELIAPDIRGHGDTPNPSDTLSPQQVAQDMFALLDALHIKRVQIAGYSFGGHVALRMAAMYPDRVDAMIVIAGAHQLLGSSRQTHRDMLVTPIPSDWWLKEVSTWHPGGKAQVRSVNRQGIEAALTDGFAMPDASLAEIRARTLIISGDRDEIFPLEVPLDLYRKIKGSQLWIIPNANHSAVFWQDVAPANTDFGGNPSANTLFADLAGAFL